MVFSSIIFLTVFLPLFLGIYYLTPNRWRSLVILVGSYSFYAWWRVDFVLLFGFVTIVNYWVSQHVHSSPHRGEARRGASNAEFCEGRPLPNPPPEGEGTRSKKWLTIGVVFNLSVLGYFKYFNFGVDSFNQLLISMGSTPWDAWSVILPIGISFYIFQAISYLIDIYRGDAKPAPSFLDFAAFIALFPQLIAGPVIRYKDIAEQFTSRTHTLAKFNEGVIYFCSGFCKKVLIADTLAPLADMMFEKSDPTMAEAWLGALAYAAQLYYDFCGYSQMAIGLGLMMGFRFIENFNHPYISRSITEFWRRWHISLSTWLKDYLYIPLGGNRKGKIRTYINLLITMVLGGFWHGANWTFIVWGAWHGAILAIERLLAPPRLRGGRGAARRRGGEVIAIDITPPSPPASGGEFSYSPYPALLAWPLTFVFVLIGWVFFRSTDMTAATNMLQGMAGLHGTSISDTLAWQITPLMLATLTIAYLVAFISPRYVKFKSKFEPGWAINMPVWEQVILLFLFVIAFCKLVAQSHSPFLYFQF